jgi:hypothetical protein
MKHTAISLAFAVAALSACAGFGGRSLNRAPELSGAEGTVRFGTAAGAETGLRVKHLTDPELLLPPGYAYVAWARESRDQPAQNLGSLRLDSDLGGALRATTALRRFDLFVTAEATSDAEAPTGRPLLWASRE